MRIRLRLLIWGAIHLRYRRQAQAGKKRSRALSVGPRYTQSITIYVQHNFAKLIPITYFAQHALLLLKNWINFQSVCRLVSDWAAKDQKGPFIYVAYSHLDLLDPKNRLPLLSFRHSFLSKRFGLLPQRHYPTKMSLFRDLLYCTCTTYTVGHCVWAGIHLVAFNVTKFLDGLNSS